MVDHNLLQELDVRETWIDEQIASAFGEGQDEMAAAIDETIGNFQPGSILKGKVVNLVGNDVIVDVGLKSEGVIGQDEWKDRSAIDIGDEIDVWLETVESDSGLVILSKRKADRILTWQRIIETSAEGDVVTGKVTRKIKGGLLVDIGVPVFLPASQVDIRRPGDISEYIGRSIDAKILKIDTDRRNIVISRRKLIEEQRQRAKDELLSTLEEGQLRKGVVKNIADFGAFVDLGGIDGLLHITDMSWDRINHPSDLLRIEQEVEVKILNVDRDREKIALGLKQKGENPWERVEERYPIESRVKGEVVNIVNYGAFVKLEPGVEGLVHISEMSWTRRIAHPSEVVNINDEIEVVVLDINKQKQEISLGLKQTEENPWMRVAEKYPPNTIVDGVVRNLANYGAFVEIEEGIDGLLHVTDISWTKKISHPSEVLKKADNVRCVVLSVDETKMRVALGIKQLSEDPWLRAVPEKYIPGQIVRGKVTKITNFGVFVELEPDLEGLLHVSELADHKVEDPHKEVELGEELDVKILRVDMNERKIGLSKKRAEWAAEEGAAAADKKIRARRGGLHGPGEISTAIIEDVLLRDPKKEAEAEGTEASAAEEGHSPTEPTSEPDTQEPPPAPESDADAATAEVQADAGKEDQTPASEADAKADDAAPPTDS